jgi:hypothetical protein
VIKKLWLETTLLTHHGMISLSCFPPYTIKDYFKQQLFEQQPVKI